ncbi:hypothetical protein [Janibacter terrae]|uniref:hypothetical protein n=1 Tax=Janibacter terrae TaxID=103817 RepID=UPI0031F7359C
MSHAGDEGLAHEQQHPELYDATPTGQWGQDGDPLDWPCDECGAEAGERCRPACTAEAGVGGA